MIWLIVSGVIIFSYVISARMMLNYFDQSCKQLSGGKSNHNHACHYDYRGTTGEMKVNAHVVHLWWAMLSSLLFPLTILAGLVMWKPNRNPKPIEDVKDKYAVERDKRISAYEKELGKH